MNTKKGAVEIYLEREAGLEGLGLHINGEASVQNLIDAWQPLCDDQTIFKSYAAGNYSGCKGCVQNCCATAYVIPDLISFRKMAALKGMDYAEFIARYFQPEKKSVGLLRMLPDPCVFLADSICTIYPVRSLICRLYICTPLLGDTEQLIYEIAWTGAAATQIYARENGLLPARSGSTSSFDQLFLNLLEEYRLHPAIDVFLQAEDYDQIPLSLFLP